MRHVTKNITRIASLDILRVGIGWGLDKGWFLVPRPEMQRLSSKPESCGPHGYQAPNCPDNGKHEQTHAN